MRKKVYIIGSLRNEEVIVFTKALEKALPGAEIFSDWYAASENADDSWRDYEKARGRSFEEALQGYAARHVFQFDKHHLDTCSAAVLLLPAGKSGHLELGYVAGQGKPTAIVLDDPERWDVMYQFAGCVSEDWDKVIAFLEENLK